MQLQQKGTIHETGYDDRVGFGQADFSGARRELAKETAHTDVGSQPTRRADLTGQRDTTHEGLTSRSPPCRSHLGPRSEVPHLKSLPSRKRATRRSSQLLSLQAGGAGRVRRAKHTSPIRSKAALALVDETRHRPGHSQAMRGALPSFAGPRNIWPLCIVNAVLISGLPSGPAFASIASASRASPASAARTRPL